MKANQFSGNGGKRWPLEGVPGTVDFARSEICDLDRGQGNAFFWKAAASKKFRVYGALQVENRSGFEQAAPMGWRSVIGNAAGFPAGNPRCFEEGDVTIAKLRERFRAGQAGGTGANDGDSAIWMEGGRRRVMDGESFRCAGGAHLDR